MGKKKQAKTPAQASADREDRGGDRHASLFVVRLPETYRQQLRELCAQTRRPMTTEVKIALEEYLAKSGFWPPEEREDSEAGD